MLEVSKYARLHLIMLKILAYEISLTDFSLAQIGLNWCWLICFFSFLICSEKSIVKRGNAATIKYYFRSKHIFILVVDFLKSHA